MRPGLATAKIHGIAPLLMSQAIPESEERRKDESWDAAELRYWKCRAHTTNTGQLFLPATYFTSAIQNAAKRRSDRIGGKKQGPTFTKHFEGGCFCSGPVMLPLNIDEISYERIFCYANGKDGSRVWRYFPCIREWSGDVKFAIIDEVLDEGIFEKTLVSAGLHVGIGAFRPINRNQNGRFLLDEFSWEPMVL